MSKKLTNNQLQQRLGISLLSLRVGIGIVFAMWTIDKFANPEHAAAVADHFYGIGGLSQLAAYALGSVQLLLIVEAVCINPMAA